MMHRLIIHVVLIFLFALTQMGVATHEISHVNDATKHQHQHKNTVTEQCEQCISFAKVANGLQIPTFAIPEITTQHLVFSNVHVGIHFHISSAYLARAPPQTTSI